MESKNILEDMKCPICLEIPEDKIFICVNGHLLCETCSNAVTTCPQCRVSVEGMKTRNLPLEQLLDTFKFDCVFNNLGCIEKLSRKDIKSHANICTFNGKRINICKQIGYPCEFLANMLDLSAAETHFQAEHNFITRNDFHFPIHVENFEKVALNTSSENKQKYIIWTPVMLNLCPDTNSQNRTRIILLCIFHTCDKSTSWMCVRLAEKNEGKEYHAEFCINSVSKAADLSWRTPAIDIEQLKILLPRSPFRVPSDLLLEHYTLPDGSLIINVKLHQMRGKRTQQQLSDDPSTLYPVLLHDRESGSSQMGGQEEKVIFRNSTCRECGVSPITGILFRSLVGQTKFSVCQDCLWRPPCFGTWFGIARKLDDENKLSGLWSRKQKEWMRSSRPGASASSLLETCTTDGCTQSAIFICLQCADTFLCSCCRWTHCNDHIFAIFFHGDPE